MATSDRLDMSPASLFASPEGVLARDANSVLDVLLKLDTPDLRIVRAKEVAQQISDALGAARSEALGFRDVPASEFVLRALSRGDLPELEQQLGEDKFKQALTSNLEWLLRKSVATVNQERRVSGDKLLDAWRALPDSVRAAYPEHAREAIASFADFVSAGMQVPRLTGLLGLTDIAATKGVNAAMTAFTARALMSRDSFLSKWLRSEVLPCIALRLLGIQQQRVDVPGLI